MTLTRMDVEKVFRTVVQNCNGFVLDESLPFSPAFRNADFIFHMEKVVAELKCLTDDNVYSEANQQKATAILQEWHRQGKIETTVLNETTWKKMPKILQTELYRVFTVSIKRRIETANRQIRETKRELKLEDYAGILFFANDGVLSIPPAAFIHATQLALQRDYHEIRHFVYLTANVFTVVRNQPVPVLFWIAFDMQDGPRIDPAFLERLGRAWRRQSCRVMGAIGVEEDLQDVECFWNSRHIGKL